MSMSDAAPTISDGSQVVVPAVIVDAGVPFVTNLLTNPSFETDLNGWTNSDPGHQTFTQDATHGGALGNSGSTALKVAFASGAVGQFYVGPIPVAALQYYVSSLYVYNPTTNGVGTATVSVQFYTDSAGSNPTGDGTQSPGSAVKDTWTRLVAPANESPVDANYAFVIVAVTSTPAGSALWVDAAMFTNGPGLPDYFDGDTVNGGGFTYAWTGTAHASTSTRSG